GVGCAVAAGHPDRGGCESSAGCSLGVVLPAGECDGRYGVAGRPLRAYNLLRRSCVLGRRHLGISGVVAAAPRTRKTHGLVPRAHAWPVIREVARFWPSRATYDPRGQRYGIAHVNSVAESNTDIANDTFTNVSAAKALSIATAAAAVLGERPDPLWSRIARLLYIPLAPGGEHHLPLDPAAMADRSDEDF